MFSNTDTIRVGRLTGRRKAASGRTAPLLRVWLALLALWGLAAPLMAQEKGGGEANLVLPDLNSVKFLGGIGGGTLLMGGLLVSALGLVFGLIIFVRLRNMPVHSSMREVSELIYETCKTYLRSEERRVGKECR